MNAQSFSCNLTAAAGLPLRAVDARAGWTLVSMAGVQRTPAHP